MMKVFQLIFGFSLLSVSVFGQTVFEVPNNWFNLDLHQEQVAGIGTERAYTDFLGDKTGVPIIVAVIDGGVDVDHEDLKGCIWVNPLEIPGNNIDDDGNGYVDDINGWNFIGGPMGNVQHDNLEFTRVYKSLRDRFLGMEQAKVSSAEKEDFHRYEVMDKEYHKRLEALKIEEDEFESFMNFYLMAQASVQEFFGKQDYTLSDLNSLDVSDERVKVLVDVLKYGLEADMEKEALETRRHYHNALHYSYNLDSNFRAVVGDDYTNLSQRIYGNNDVKGPEALHGTHVAGIIAANRNNDIGIKGISDSAQIMVLRVVPDGDERDKDVANAIYYAVDHGAKIINMSFGKSLSPQKSYVDEAVAYAASKGVVLVHAAGNDGKNIDVNDNFPNRVNEQTREHCPTWIEVGASTTGFGEDIVAEFSNYGKKAVDVFAPGQGIHSCAPENTYQSLDGTSMAAPVVSGMAAVLWSYYPDLRAKDVVDIIVNGYTDYGKVKVKQPGSASKAVKFKKLSRTGGVVNLYQSVKMAEQQTYKAVE